jgi:nucleoside-diphosphate-sugar epimerase
MDNTRLNSLGWQSEVDLEQGIRQAYKDYCINGIR